LSIREQIEQLRNSIKEQYGLDVNVGLTQHRQPDMTPSKAASIAGMVSADMGPYSLREPLPDSDDPTLRWYTIKDYSLNAEFILFFEEKETARSQPITTV
jgi:hypothetical protein